MILLKKKLQDRYLKNVYCTVNVTAKMIWWSDIQFSQTDYDRLCELKFKPIIAG